MSEAKAIIRRIERSQERDWQAAYIRLLPPVPAPTRTPDCTCDWIEEKLLCVAESTYFHTRYAEDCPDHKEPEPIP